MAYETQKDKDIKQMHQNKLRSYSDSQLGQAVGAAVNKACDLAIAYYGDKLSATEQEEVCQFIKSWTNRIYAISQDKKDWESNPVEIEKGGEGVDFPEKR